MRNPSVINLAAGLVDPLTLPVRECASITGRIFSDPLRGQAALQYDTTLGLAALRTTVLRHMEQLEGKPASAMGLTADDIVVTTGSQQSLYLLGDVLLDPGDIVIAAQPSYFVYTGALASLGARVLTVPMDEMGMDVEAVARVLERLESEGQLGRVKMVYCTSYFQNPTGLTLSRERRPRLLEIVKRFSRRQRITILEDAAYRELRYDGEALASIKSYDAENLYTALSQTFSKPFAPGLKLGYTAMPADLLEAVLHQKGNHDFGSSSLAQHIAVETLRDGTYHKHVEVLQKSYRLKRDTMLAALDQLLPHEEAGITWTRPHGGLYVWVTLPPHFDTSRGGPMFDACIAAGVMYVPGDYCSQPDESGRTPRHQLRLSFGQVAVEQIVPGIERSGGRGALAAGFVGIGRGRAYSSATFGRGAGAMSRTIFWYIFKDLVRVFMLASGALAGIMSFGGLLRPLTHQGLDIGQVGQVLTYFGPAMTTYSFPVAALFATTVIYGRLAADNELTACRAGGLSLASLSVAGPALVLGLLVATVSLLFLCFVVPVCTLKVERVLYSNLAQLVKNRIERNHEIDFAQYTIFAQEAWLPTFDAASPNQQAVVLRGPTIVTVDRPVPASPTSACPKNSGPPRRQ